MIFIGRTIIFLLLLIFFIPSYGEYKFDIPSDQAMTIAVKIWNNECDATVDGLLGWNKGENFASLGIGHFVWHTEAGAHSRYDEFPRFIRYLRKQNVPVPSWLNYDVIPACPWVEREEFIHAKRAHSDSRLEELKLFLVRTIPWQIKYMLSRLEITLPSLIASVPPEEVDDIYRELDALLSNPLGVYALVDYLNFKGSGIYAAKNRGSNRVPSHGLVQVLEEMRNAPKEMNPNQAFSWAAQNVLIRRCYYSPLGSYDEKWLKGWIRRVKTYCQ